MSIGDSAPGSELTRTEFFFSLDRNVEDVDSFYNRKYADASRRLKLLQDRYGRYLDASKSLDREEVEDLMGALLDLRGLLRKLQWYGEVNRRGFIKITKKLDKKVGEVATQRRYLDSKVEHKPFATNVALNETMKTVNEWLSKIGDIHVLDDASSTRSSHSLQHAASDANLQVQAELWDDLERAIRTDHATDLVDTLTKAKASNDIPKTVESRLYMNLLHRAISARAKDCVPKLLSRIDSLEKPSDINKRNCIHRFVITYGKAKVSKDADVGSNQDTTAQPDMRINGAKFLKPAAAPPSQPVSGAHRRENDAPNMQQDAKTIGFLELLLDSFSPAHRTALQAKDTYGRTPLHYAAQHGLVSVVDLIIRRIQQWSLYVPGGGAGQVFEADADGLSPLHLSVANGHPVTTQLLLKAAEPDDVSTSREEAQPYLAIPDAVLATAVKSNFPRIVELLIGAGVNVNYQDEQGETALHIAARLGHLVCAKILLDGTYGSKADTELIEKTFGWTPLHVACVDGRADITECFIKAGADIDKLDGSGWTAREHAALRGHVAIAQKIAAVSQAPTIGKSDLGDGACNGEPMHKGLIDRTSKTNTNGQSSMRKAEPIKSFGHRYLSKETMVLVSLGSMDTRSDVEAVSLDQVPISSAHSTQLDTALSVIVSSSGAKGEPSIIDLPPQESLNTEPITFTTTDVSRVKLMFDLVPTYSGSTDQIVGRAVALLSSIKPSIGSNRMCLQGDLTVPILAVQTMDVIGSVHFNFLIITPFTHPKMTINEEMTYWKSMSSTMVIGHRGLGKNSASRSSLQLGENTIQSFIAAANLGASYVEFDVQLTKDHVPVIYHDFLVSETGIDAPVHTLTLEQFLHISNTRSRPPTPPPQPGPQHTNPARTNGEARKTRSMSLGASQKDEPNMSERMRHTRDFKAKGFKGNSRGASIQAPFTTLEEMFRTLPASIGFNIEMKYPMLWESEEQEMDAYAVELNSFVDTVLTKVYDHSKTEKGSRNIIFSSFNPDVCLMLSFKQPSIPVLFLTDAGTAWAGDVRASSLQEAIRFASRWNLLGVVTAAEPLILAPRLVKVVKESGLVCVSYGTLNNDPENVKVSPTTRLGI